MRKLGHPSEIGRLAAPLLRVLDGAWQRMHWWIALMALLYILSGVTVVRSDEVAVILRWGRLVGDTPALQAHGPGLLFAFPRPVDQVMRVQVKHVWEVPVNTLAAGPASASDDNTPTDTPTLDPLTQGYALTGDQNIVHVTMVARYRVQDPGEWAFYGPRAEDVLRVEVTAAMVRSLGEMGVDRVLSDGRKELIAAAARRAQAGLDLAHSGLELSSLELTNLTPPMALADDFNAVQSAFIEAGDEPESSSGLRREGHPRCSGSRGRRATERPGRGSLRLEQSQGRCRGFSSAGERVSREPCGGEGAALPRCRRTRHRRRRQCPLVASTRRRDLSRFPHYHPPGWGLVSNHHRGGRGLERWPYPALFPRLKRCPAFSRRKSAAASALA